MSRDHLEGSIGAPLESGCQHSGQLLLWNVVGRDRNDRVHLAGFGQQGFGGVPLEQHSAGATLGVGVSVVGDADDPEGPGVSSGEHGRCVADRVARALGAGVVDDDLVTTDGSAAVDEVERIQLVGARPVEPERRHGRLIDDRLSVRSDQLRVADDLDVCLSHLRQLRDRIEQGAVDGDAGLCEVQGDRFRGADQSVDVLVGGLDDAVDGGGEGVGEDEGAGHERNTEDDGERRRHQSHPVGDQVLECEHEHRQVPIVWMRWMTASAVGSSMSSTMRPSLRNTARSACAAATGSWVTITIV